jgi:hypothetical protein
MRSPTYLASITTNSKKLHMYQSIALEGDNDDDLIGVAILTLDISLGNRPSGGRSIGRNQFRIDSFGDYEF